MTEHPPESAPPQEFAPPPEFAEYRCPELAVPSRQVTWSHGTRCRSSGEVAGSLERAETARDRMTVVVANSVANSRSGRRTGAGP
ncbi:hypothetical protein [Actinokineospora cianjurensis]|uniref:hypothetical protein n=1 Tax=Actinokineospora cianjurensis TaxID=585224 RepID=UPI0011C4005F|nr:hypothetical protein [Actinokineospora cianjurensis]